MSDDEKKIVSLKTMLDMEKDEMTAAVEGFRRGLSGMMEMQRMIAKLQRARFNALVAEGFTQEQALELTAQMILLIE